MFYPDFILTRLNRFESVIGIGSIDVDGFVFQNFFFFLRNITVTAVIFFQHRLPVVSDDLYMGGSR